MPFTLTPISVKNSAGEARPMIVYNDGTNNAFANAVVDSTGAIVSPATSGLQTTANSTLSTIASQTSGVATAAAQATGNGTLATLVSNVGGTNDTAASSDTGNFSLMALFKRLLQSFTTLNSRTPALGSALSAASTPVVIASDQAALPLPAGAATSSLQTTGNTSLATIATASGTQATAANQAATNTKLDTVITNTTSIATAANQTSTNTKLDTVIANTGAGSVSLTITPAVTAGAYAAGMVAGGKLSLTTAVRASAGSGVIQSVSVSKKTALTAPYDVYFFSADPTNSTFTDNAALALNVADLPLLVGVAHCTDLVDNGTPKTLQATNVALPFKLASGTTLFAVPVIRGAETLASTSALILNVGILQA